MATDRIRSAEEFAQDLRRFVLKRSECSDNAAHSLYFDALYIVDTDRMVRARDREIIEACQRAAVRACVVSGANALSTAAVRLEIRAALAHLLSEAQEEKHNG